MNSDSFGAPNRASYLVQCSCRWSRRFEVSMGVVVLLHQRDPISPRRR
ncbi:MAG TPA: hypothetical protein VMS16_04745 [Mycobacterium sp.]|nr:hypothetical protein [Mycobacterium sp.]